MVESIGLHAPRGRETVLPSNSRQAVNVLPLKSYRCGKYSCSERTSAVLPSNSRQSVSVLPLNSYRCGKYTCSETTSRCSIGKLAQNCQRVATEVVP